MRRIFLLFILILAPSAFAQSIAQLHQCYGKLGEAAVFQNQALGHQDNQVFVSQKSVNEKSFLIFSNRNVYRCPYPNPSGQKSCRMSLRAGAEVYSGVIDVSKSTLDKPKEICNVTCSEELGEATMNLIKAEIAEHIAETHRLLEKEKAQAQAEGLRDCNALGVTVKREVSKLLLGSSSSETDCFNKSTAMVNKTAEEKRQKAIAALKTCGGELQDLANAEIDKLEGRIRSMTADSEADEDAPIDSALGQK